MTEASVAQNEIKFPIQKICESSESEYKPAVFKRTWQNLFKESAAPNNFGISEQNDGLLSVRIETKKLKEDRYENKRAFDFNRSIQTGSQLLKILGRLNE